MDNQLQAHPDQSQLSAFALGQLEPGDIEEIGQHLADCGDCRAAVKQVPNDTFVSLVRDCETESVVEPQPAAAAQPTIDQAPDFDSPGAATIPPTLDADPAQPVAAGHTFRLDPALVDHSRYHIVDLIGMGGMGAVYKAEHRLMQRTVALKVINPQFVANQSSVERFQREVRAAARLHHPNIVTAYDAEQAGDMHFLVMEYVPGTDLAEVLQQRGPLPAAEACDYVRQAALGLQHALEQGMVHRDIKPHNLMLTDKGQVKILDFGLAALTGDETRGSVLTQVGSIMGTPDYIAPEQARDTHSADIRADIYSLGCTLYQLLTGRVPFPEGQSLDKIMAHVEREPVPLTEFRPDIPEAVIEVLNKMMAKDRADRYQTPAELAEALAAIQSSVSTRPSPPRRGRGVGVRGKRPQPARRSPWPLVATLIAAAAVVLLGGVIWVATDNGQLKIDCKVDDVQVVVSKGGREYEVIDLKSGTTVKHLPSGEYKIALKGDRTDVKLSKGGFTITRWGKEIVSVTREAAVAAKAGLLRAFAPTEPTITREGVTSVHFKYPDERPSEHGWRIDTAKPRTVRLFELPNPAADDGILTFRAKMMTKIGKAELGPPEKLQGKAYLEMWCRFPGQGEFFSKGIDNPLQGTTAWRSFETSFVLKKGQIPDLLKLNVVFEGKGTLWIKDVEVHFTPTGEQVAAAIDMAELSRVVRAGRGQLSDEERQELLAQNHPLLGQLADPHTKKIIELFAKLPDAMHKQLLNEGCLKWKFASLDAARQKVYHDSLKLNLDMAEKQGVKPPATMSLDALKKADVGFAVVEIPELKTKVVSWYILLPEHPAPIWVTVVGVEAAGKPAYFQAHQQQLPEVRKKPYSPMPADSGDMGPAKEDDLPPLVRTTFEGHKGTVNSVRFSPNGQWLASCGLDATARIWKVDSGQQVHSLSEESNGMGDVAFSPDSTFLLTGSYGGHLRLWDVKTGKPTQQFLGHTKNIMAAAFSPDGKWIASAGADQFIFLWRADTGELIRKLPTQSGCSALVFSPDGKRLISGHPLRAIFVWDVETGEKVHILSGHLGPVYDLDVTPDGRYLFSCGQQANLIHAEKPDPKGICVWDLQTGDLVRSFSEPKAFAVSMTISPDGRTFATGSKDGTIRIRDVQSGEEMYTVKGHTGPVGGLAFSPDGKQLTSSSADSSIRLWQLPPHLWPGAKVQKIPPKEE